jgi:hypothetical protein
MGCGSRCWACTISPPCHGRVPHHQMAARSCERVPRADVSGRAYSSGASRDPCTMVPQGVMFPTVSPAARLGSPLSSGRAFVARMRGRAPLWRSLWRRLAPGPPCGPQHVVTVCMLVDGMHRSCADQDTEGGYESASAAGDTVGTLTSGRLRCVSTCRRNGAVEQRCALSNMGPPWEGSTWQGSTWQGSTWQGRGARKAVAAARRARRLIANHVHPLSCSPRPWRPV